MRDSRFTQLHMRDTNPSGLVAGNNLPPGNPLTRYGWMGEAIGTMGNLSRWAISLNPDNTIIAGSTAALQMPLETLSTTPSGLLNACYIACQGQAQKNYGAAFWNSTLAAQTIALTTPATTVFGVRVRITNSVLNSKLATYEIQLANAGVVQSYILVETTSLPVDVIILAISNAAGKAAVVGNTSPSVIIPYSAVAGTAGFLNGINLVGTAAVGGVSDVINAETLNMRDIGQIITDYSAGVITI